MVGEVVGDSDGLDHSDLTGSFDFLQNCFSLLNMLYCWYSPTIEQASSSSCCEGQININLSLISNKQNIYKLIKLILS